jgi:hypothetical protein
MRELSNVRIVCLTLATAGRLMLSGAKEGFLNVFNFGF